MHRHRRRLSSDASISTPSNFFGGLSPCQTQALSPVSQQTKLVWVHGGHDVRVTGAFNDWGEAIKLEQFGAEFVTTLRLVPGVYQYKYIVDNEWRVDPLKPQVSDECGNINNFVEVEQIELEDEDPFWAQRDWGESMYRVNSVGGNINSINMYSTKELAQRNLARRSYQDLKALEDNVEVDGWLSHTNDSDEHQVDLFSRDVIGVAIDYEKIEDPENIDQNLLRTKMHFRVDCSLFRITVAPFVEYERFTRIPRLRSISEATEPQEEDRPPPTTSLSPSHCDPPSPTGIVDPEEKHETEIVERAPPPITSTAESSRESLATPLSLGDKSPKKELFHNFVMSCLYHTKVKLTDPHMVQKYGFSATQKHKQIDLSWGNLRAKKLEQGLYRSVRSALPVQNTCLAYFEVTFLKEQYNGGICVGLSVGKSDFNALVGSDKHSLGFYSLGNAISNGEWQKYGSPVGVGSRIGCLVMPKFHDDESQNFAVSFYADGQCLGEPLPYSCPQGLALYPTISIYTPGTTVLGHFAPWDISSVDSLGYGSVHSIDGVLLSCGDEDTLVPPPRQLSVRNPSEVEWEGVSESEEETTSSSELVEGALEVELKHRHELEQRRDHDDVAYDTHHDDRSYGSEDDFL